MDLSKLEVEMATNTDEAMRQIHELRHKFEELKAVGVEVDHGDELKESKRSYQVGDLQHLEICELRLEGYTYEEIGKYQGTSKGTPWKHIQAHNEEVERLGECQRCKRAKSPLSTVIITGEKPIHVL